MLVSPPYTSTSHCPHRHLRPPPPVSSSFSPDGICYFLLILVAVFRWNRWNASYHPSDVLFSDVDANIAATNSLRPLGGPFKLWHCPQVLGSTQGTGYVMPSIYDAEGRATIADFQVPDLRGAEFTSYRSATLLSFCFCRGPECKSATSELESRRARS